MKKYFLLSMMMLMMMSATARNIGNSFGPMAPPVDEVAQDCEK